mgnify:CR=1 FL=1
MTSSPPPSPLEAIFSEQGRLRRFLEFEAALAMAEAELGIIPREAADDIIRIATADTVDLAVLRSETERTGYPIAPLVRQLVAACDGDHGQYVHWGSTTQDVMDTALALQMRQGLDAIEADLKAIAAVLVDIVIGRILNRAPNQTGHHRCQAFCQLLNVGIGLGFIIQLREFFKDGVGARRLCLLRYICARSQRVEFLFEGF